MLRKLRNHTRAVHVTDYIGKEPAYFYTSLSQDENADGIKEPVENEYQEIPVGRWNGKNTADTSDFSEADVVEMKVYEEAPVTNHRLPSYDEDMVWWITIYIKILKKVLW